MKDFHQILKNIYTHHSMIIGSKAIQEHYPDYPRLPKDLDIVTDKDITSTKEVEYHKNDILMKYFKHESFLNPIALLTLKASHAVGWDINWNKHMFDIQFLLNKGVQIDDKLFHELYDYWTKVHGENKRSDLDMTANEFFDNAVKCEYDHDWLHSLLVDSPTYKLVLKDNSEVDVSEDKFNMLSHEQKCSLVREEVIVMAFERMFNDDYRINYQIMLKKFILNHAPLWEALFIIKNYEELKSINFNYINYLNERINR